MVLESVSGLKVLCDPYDDSCGYSPPADAVDIVTVSHDHFDHNAVDVVKGAPVIFKETGEFKEEGIEIRGIHTWHDTEGGNKRGSNIVYRFEIDNINFIHMGDVGHVLTEEQVADIKPCDILAVPVGGVYTVDAGGAREIVSQLDPQIVIPVHYHTPSNKIGLNTAEDFLKDFPEVRREEIWEGTRGDIPERVMIYVLAAHGEG